MSVVHVTYGSCSLSLNDVEVEKNKAGLVNDWKKEEDEEKENQGEGERVKFKRHCKRALGEREKE
jgi:hypothetical protein